MPEGGSPWALAELVMNCRNTREIANFVRRLGGGVAASASPEGDPIKFISAINEDSLVQTVLRVIDDHAAIQGFNMSDIVIITGTAAERNLFYNLQSSKYVFSKWEDRSNLSIACETAKRAKGIEAEHVIIATLNEEIRKNEMYVAASRARASLVIVGPNRLDERFQVSI